VSAHVVATRAGNRRLPSETRSTGWGGGAWLDPTAIPPPGFGQLQRAGVIVSEKSLLQVDVVFTALRIITTAILKMGDPRAYQEELSDDNIPFRRFLADQPEVLSDTFGGRLFQYDGRRRTLMSMALFGEAFWYVLDRDRLAYPAALDVLHPAFMEVKVASAIDVRANRAQAEGDSMYIYGSGRDKKLLDPDDVIHIPFMAMPQARRALSSVEYVAVSGALAMAAYEFGSTWFSQGASPSFLLSTEAKLGQAEVERIAEKFVIDHAGLGSAHLPLVLDNGLKADKVMASPDEAQYTTPLALDEPILTGDGWKTMGTVGVGDIVYAEDGSPTAVMGLSPVFPDRECFELEFADGTKIVASDNHRWHVWDSRAGQTKQPRYYGEWKTLTTAEVTANWRWYDQGFRYSVACDGVVQSPEADLPIDPYLLGYWLGDGTTGDTSITVGTDDRGHVERAVHDAGLAVTTVTEIRGGWGSSWRVRFNGGAKGELRAKLRGLGILNDKRIPDCYLMASPAQRRALLAGLLDSDGSAGPRVRFVSTLPGLAADVLTLARSLGARAKIVQRDLPPREGVKTSKRQLIVEWTATFDPFQMARKSANVPARVLGDRDLRRMSIIGVRSVESRPTRCIRIHHPSHVFLVGRTFVPTGNTLEYSRNVIASWFGVDEMIPNALQRQTPQPAHTSQERMQRFITFTLSGYTVPLEEAYSSLLPKGRKATLPEDNLLTPDPQGLSEEITALRQTQVATPNDLRVRKLHWPPSDDPAADEIIAPLASNTAPSQAPGPGSTPALKDDGT
jgi:phage portal protein BeeE